MARYSFNQHAYLPDSFLQHLLLSQRRRQEEEADAEGGEMNDDAPQEENENVGDGRREIDLLQHHIGNVRYRLALFKTALFLRNARDEKPSEVANLKASLRLVGMFLRQPGGRFVAATAAADGENYNEPSPPDLSQEDAVLTIHDDFMALGALSRFQIQELRDATINDCTTTLRSDELVTLEQFVRSLNDAAYTRLFIVDGVPVAPSLATYSGSGLDNNNNKSKKRKASAISQDEEELLQQAQQQQAEQRLLDARLSHEIPNSWYSLDREHKYCKRFVLFILQSKKPLPGELEERVWSGDLRVWWRDGHTHPAIPDALQADRDILLARLQREDFAKCYTSQFQFDLPEAFRQDEAVVLATIKRYPDILRRDYLDAFLDQDSAFLAYLESQPVQSAAVRFWNDGSDKLYEILPRFSDRIRGTRALMSRAADRIQDTQFVLMHIAGSLAKDTLFAEHLVQVWKGRRPCDQVLSCFSPEIRTNRGLVISFVKKNGRCLECADDALKKDTEVVKLACDLNPSTILCALPFHEVLPDLFENKAFIKSVLDRWRYDSLEGSPALYKLLPPTLQLDLDIIVKARATGNFSAGDLPSQLAEDQEFWTQVIKRDSLFWSLLPDNFVNDVDFVRAIDCFANVDLIGKVLGVFPHLAEDRDFWPAVFASSELLKLADAITKHTPNSIRQDRELMIKACNCDSKVLPILSSDLQTDRAVLEAAVDGNGFPSLSVISRATQLLHPDLVVKALTNRCDDRNDDRYHAHIEQLEGNSGNTVATELWSDIRICTAWLKNGGTCLPFRASVHPFQPSIPAAMQDNQDFCLAIAEGSSSCWVEDESCIGYHEQEYARYFRAAASTGLRGNKAFMMKAVGKEPLLLACAEGGLERDFDLAIVAFGGKHGSARKGRTADLLYKTLLPDDMDDNRFNGKIDFLQQVRQDASTRCSDYLAFAEFLHVASARSNCPLYEVFTKNAGDEFVLAFKRTIAKYLCLLTRGAEEIDQVCRASDALDREELPAKRQV